MGNSIMIMCEQSGGRILPITYELISCAAQLADYYHSRITTVLPGFITDPGAVSGADLLVINSPGLAQYTCEGWERAANAIDQGSAISIKNVYTANPSNSKIIAMPKKPFIFQAGFSFIIISSSMFIAIIMISLL
jgi:hypothetical protein